MEAYKPRRKLLRVNCSKVAFACKPPLNLAPFFWYTYQIKHAMEQVYAAIEQIKPLEVVMGCGFWGFPGRIAFSLLGGSFWSFGTGVCLFDAKQTGDHASYYAA